MSVYHMVFLPLLPVCFFESQYLGVFFPYCSSFEMPFAGRYQFMTLTPVSPLMHQRHSAIVLFVPVPLHNPSSLRHTSAHLQTHFARVVYGFIGMRTPNGICSHIKCDFSPVAELACNLLIWWTCHRRSNQRINYWKFNVRYRWSFWAIESHIPAINSPV